MAKLNFALAALALVALCAVANASYKMPPPSKRPPPKKPPMGWRMRPEVPAGSISAWSYLMPVEGKESYGKGSVQLVIPPAGMGDGWVWISLEGWMHDVIMMHIHEHNTTLGNPIRLDLLPRLPPGAPAGAVKYYPPLDYYGQLGATIYFNSTDIDRWNPTMPGWDYFLGQLKMGMLYANVHTVANPGGEIMGDFKCADMCSWM
ncbi:hypothetical protein HYH03_011584 [Edaphochlamys debaryana]|uniref:CHRD domain-containing protein n=1 Tax=Edaphochlamys debaryana TaxID=47281 RepID=A0A836BWC0_9CHLO|nr:hypothetical protein HYH03_011584 [Edaphochlamys debaryana]|eukprot:KAG2489954.1 hypothetical protein HYH03_011584 [Edaphochlamys debaryana]